MFAIWKRARQAYVPVETPIVKLLLKDGTLFFLWLLVANLLELGIYIKNVDAELSALVSIFTSIIVVHFLLSLRQAAPSSPEDTEIDAQLSFYRSKFSVWRSKLRLGMLANMEAELQESFDNKAGLQYFSSRTSLTRWMLCRRKSHLGLRCFRLLLSGRREYFVRCKWTS